MAVRRRIGPRTMALVAPRALLCLIAAMLLACCASKPALAWSDEGDEALGRPLAESGLPEDRRPSIDAAFAALVDESGTLWFGREAAARAQIASLTKVMTAIVASEHLGADSPISVTPEAAAVGESSAGLQAGDEMPFGDALKAVLTASGNDAASAVAQAAGAALLDERGQTGDAYACEAAFIEAMNAKAAELGMTDTFFTNPHGLDFDAFAQGQYSCARDAAMMLRHAMGLEMVRANLGFTRVSITVKRGGVPISVELANTDTMLEGYEGTCAAKTGYTLAAGPCVATAVNRGDGHEYYAVVLASSSKPQRFADSEALYDWIYANRADLEAAAQAAAMPAEPETITYELLSAPRSQRAVIDGVKDAWPVVAEVAHAEWPKRTVAATVRERTATVALPKEGGRIEQEATFAEVKGDVKPGDAVGHMAFRRDGVLIWESDLVAVEHVAAPTWWEAAGVAIERFFGGFAGTPATAESRLLNLGALAAS